MKKREFLISLGAASTLTLLGRFAQASEGAPPKAAMVSLSKDLSAYYAVPEAEGKFPAILVFMEAFGLNDNIKSICNYLASEGYAALAPDFYRGETFAYTDRQNAIAKLKTLKDDEAMADVGTSLKFLSDRPEIEADKIGTVGFCMGGRLSFLANITHSDRLKATVSFYGGGIADPEDKLGRPFLLDRVSSIKARLLLIYGASDQSIKSSEVEKISKALLDNNKNYIISVFAGAGHGFAAYGRDSYVEEVAKQAWTQTMDFFAEYLEG